MLALPLLTSPAPAISLDEIVAEPAEVLLADRHTPAGFRIIALSHLAEASADGAAERGQARATAALERITEAALDPGINRIGDLKQAPLGDHGLYLSHLAIVLGSADRLSPESCDRALHDRIVDHLVDRALGHPSGVGRSFASSPARWPTDQAATLYGVHLYDRAHGTSKVDAPLQRYLQTVGTGGLPPSELTGTVPDHELPRGSSLAFLVRYLAPVAPQPAQQLWQRTRDTFLVRLGPAAGLREWQPGVERVADIDSGPIVSGIGASATAFGLAAAWSVGDTATATALQRTAELGALVASVRGGGLQQAADSVLATAISARTEALAAQATTTGPRP